MLGNDEVDLDLSQKGLAPGQFYGNRWIIYSALSEPVIRADEWHLKTSGLVEKPLDLSYDQMQKLPQSKITKDFQCLLPNTIVYANPEPKEIQQLSVGDAIIGADGRKHIIKKMIRKQHSSKVIGVKAPTFLPR